MQAPVMVMNTNSKRETGRKAQLTNIQAAKVNLFHRRVLPPFFQFCVIHAGCLRNNHFHSRPSIYVEDAS